ncbi:hypothetical protein N0V88_004157 [Collariella sp. IMI 366227]|nr:hypothetical protein N0V88_004157 [Collariella sp. IMI 366227]
MPAVDVAMERSLRRGFLDLLVASLRPAVGRRDIQGQISDVKTAFSSWDNCMQVNYCKYYAEFDAGGKKNEDALPQMPSWEGAEQKKVLMEQEEGVEMNALKKPETGAQAAGAIGVATASSPTGSQSPANRSPYGPPGVDPQSNGYFAPPGVGKDPYAQAAPSYSQPGMAYSELEQGYGMAGTVMGPGRRSPHAPNNGAYNTGYNNTGYGQGGQDPYDNYGAARQQQPYGNYDNYNSQNNTTPGYGIARHQTPHYEMDASAAYPPEPRRTPGPYGAESRRSPAPQQGQYGAAYTSDARHSPAPQGQYPTTSPYPTESRRTPGPQADYSSRRTPLHRRLTVTTPRPPPATTITPGLHR